MMKNFTNLFFLFFLLCTGTILGKSTTWVDTQNSDWFEDNNRSFELLPSSSESFFNHTYMVNLVLQAPNTYTWTGATNTNWSTNSNWLNNVAPPTNVAVNIIFSTTVANDIILTENVMIMDYENMGSANFDVNGNRLTITGGFTTNASNFIKASAFASEIYFKGAAAQNISPNVFENDIIKHLIIENAVSLTLDTPISVTGVVSLRQGYFYTNDQFTFKSYFNRTAVLGSIQGGEVVGEVTVETYFPAKRAFRFFSSAVSTTGSIKQNWQEGVNNTTTAQNLNPNPGYGTHITGSMNGNNGFDATPSGNSSLFTYDDSAQIWTSINTTSQNLIEAGKAYRLMIRGDRSINLNSNTATPTPTVIRTKGTLNQGNVQLTTDAPANGYVFMGNPYQAIVDMEKVLTNSPQINPQFIYVWDPTVNVRGAFVTVQTLYNTNTNASSSANKFLQPGQSIFVKKKNVSGTVAINFEEGDKEYSNQTIPVFRAQASETATLHVNMFVQNDTENSIDGFAINFNTSFNDAVNEADAGKLFNLDENIAINTNNELLSLENRSEPISGDEIQLANYTYRASDYQLKLELNGLEMVNASLYDAYLDTYTPLENNQTNWFSFSVDQDIEASINSNRFKIVFTESSLNTQVNVLEQNVQMYPNPATTDLVFISAEDIAGNKSSVSVYSILGNRMFTQDFAAGSSNTLELNISSLAAGMYIVNVNTNDKSFSKKLIVK
ncbi:T9SS type A sorting domain-containing protein [Mesonia ostreae]|uniref:T9SS type A sorting domain-containing protein n=1 Tax=Mesonia ostreae TaxID=861110 RepID=A0ABU2KLZ4_9FLAO|nr:T9SS type A sorting domain-containing protein [Mesonia ostreae]MDT0295720.1 T9SS type A sorting domain-containing protein [Mesonia ostreae]